MASRRCVSALVSFALAAPTALTVGCDGPDDDNPPDRDAISVGSTRWGEPTAVSVQQWTSERTACRVRSGRHVDKGIDCWDERLSAASLRSITCVPAESCTGIAIDGSRGSFLPRVPSFSVHVVADIEGVRVETTRAVNVEPSKVKLELSPVHLLPGTYVSFCRGAPEELEMKLAVIANGHALESDRELLQGCPAYLPEHAGVLRGVAHLVESDADLPAIEATVHPLSDVEAVTVFDYICPGNRGDEIGAYMQGAEGTWIVHVQGSGIVRLGEHFTWLPIPGSRVRLLDGEQVIETERVPGAVQVRFVLEAPPGPNAKLEIDLDGRIVSRAVRAKPCD